MRSGSKESLVNTNLQSMREQYEPLLDQKQLLDSQKSFDNGVEMAKREQQNARRRLGEGAVSQLLNSSGKNTLDQG